MIVLKRVRLNKITTCKEKGISVVTKWEFLFLWEEFVVDVIILFNCCGCGLFMM